MYISSTNNLSSILSSYGNSSSNTTNQNSTTSTVTSPTNSNSKVAMRNLVDKVASGNGSDSDIEALAAKLKEMATQRQKNTTSTEETSTSTELDSLMEKIKNGTATDEDVKQIATDMKERASDMQAHFGGMSRPVIMGENSGDGMKELVDKVAGGTGTPPPPKPPGGKPPEGMPPIGETSSLTDSSSSTSETLLALLEELEAQSTSDTADSTKKSNSLVSSQQLLDSFMQAYSQNYSNYVATSSQDLKA